MLLVGRGGATDVGLILRELTLIVAPDVALVLASIDAFSFCHTAPPMPTSITPDRRSGRCIGGPPPCIEAPYTRDRPLQTDDPRATPSLITIPASDPAFRRLVGELEHGGTPDALQARLRKVFPRVAVRERMISGAPAWYVYRDGSWRSELAGSWFDDERLPRVVLSREGWLEEANSLALGILGIHDTDIGAAHLTDFVMPGTLEDVLALFRIIEAGHPLDATVLLRPATGDVIAIDLHASLEGDRIVGVFRLADDVEADADPSQVGAPRDVEYSPPYDVVFRLYVQRLMGRMPEVTADGLVLRLRRLYPHAAVDETGDRWVIRRDHAATGQAETPWWREGELPRVRYDAKALILEANTLAESFFGRPMVGHHWQEFVTPGSTEQVSATLEILSEIGAAESRFRMPRGDGSLVEFDSYTEVEGDMFVTVFRSIPAEA